MSKIRRMVVLTGAGMSAQSGLKTFRDSDGLWMGHNIQDVATPRGFARDPNMVLDFYNMRRQEVALAQPNAAHKALAALEEYFDVAIVTQNIDDLHERAGSSSVMHLHGEIFKMHSLASPENVLVIRGDINVGDLGEDGTQLRPHIVWFEEPVPLIETAAQLITGADIFLLIGTSLQVYPAAGLINYVPLDVPKYIIDKKIPAVGNFPNMYLIQKTATDGMEELMQLLALS